MSKAERGVKEAEAAAESVLGASAEGGDEQLQIILSHTSSSSPSGVSEDELRDLESTAKMARTAGSTAPQVKQDRSAVGCGSRVLYVFVFRFRFHFVVVSLSMCACDVAPSS